MNNIEHPLRLVRFGEMICRINELAEQTSAQFALPTAKGPRSGFLIRYQGRFYAYLNRCMHMPLSLDYETNQFLTKDGCHLLCQTHGALYDPKTGQCIGGPPIGLSLIPIKISVRDATIYLDQAPDDFPADALD